MSTLAGRLVGHRRMEVCWLAVLTTWSLIDVHCYRAVPLVVLVQGFCLNLRHLLVAIAWRMLSYNFAQSSSEDGGRQPCRACTAHRVRLFQVILLVATLLLDQTLFPH